jgi:zinc protease
VKTWQTILVLTLVGAISLGAQNKPVEHLRDLVYPPPGNITPPKLERFVMANGMTVLLVQDHELPLVRVWAVIRVGSRWEPIEKAGLADLVGTVMRTGGTAERSGDKLDEEMDQRGGSIEFSIMDEVGSAGLSVLKEDIDTGLEILADLLQHPAFPQDKIDLAKIAQRDAISRRNDYPSELASREFSRILLGRDSAYGHQKEYATVDSVNREDLIAFHRDYFQPENIILGACGDFGSEIKIRIEKLFGQWPKGSRPKPAIPPVLTSPQRCAGCYLINKGDINESSLLIGHLVGRRDDPDFYVLDLMNQVLGTGFSSRLFSNVRSAQGLAYAVWSTWDAGWDRAGTFSVTASTKTETTAQILNSIKAEITRLIDSGITESELSRVKEATARKLAFDFDSTSKILQRLLTYEYYGYPSDYDERYQVNVATVTRQDVARVAKQYLKPDQFTVLVVGNTNRFDRPLSNFGRVTELDVTIPGDKSNP